MTPTALDPAHLDRCRLAARLHYLDGLPQVEVGKILECSQAVVSRLLHTARERGIVRISVDEYQPRNPDLERRLTETYGLHRAVVVRSPGGDATPAAATRRNLAYFAAPLVADLLRPNQVVGLTGGRTLAELVPRVRPVRAPLRDLRVVQLMGTISAAVQDDDAVVLSRTLADHTGGAAYALNTPAFLSTAASRTALLNQPQVRSVWTLFNQMSLALVGVGTLEDSAFIERNVLTPPDLSRLRRAGAVGEICGRFYDAHGDECPTDFRKKIVSIDLTDLKKVPEVVAVTAGPHRAPAIATALRARLITSLIADEPCARAILQPPTPSTPRPPRR